MHHSCQEVRIPVSWGSLAGKLWVPLSPSPGTKTGALAIHGLLDNAGSFDPLIPYFPLDIPVLAIDLPGHGLSDHIHADARCYYFIDLLSDMIEVLRYMSWERPLLIGHSLGCVFILAIGAILESRISGLVMIEYSHLPMLHDLPFFEFLKNIKGSESKTEQHFKVYPSMTAIVDRLMEVKTGLTRDSAEILCIRSCKRVDKGGFVFTRDPRIMNGGSVYDHVLFIKLKNQIFFKQLTMPTLIISALDSIKFEDWIKIDNLELTPTTEVKHVKGSHHVHMNDPSLIGRIIAEFLSQRITSKL